MKKSKLFLMLFIVAMLTILVILLVMSKIVIDNAKKEKANQQQAQVVKEEEKVDDWCYEPQSVEYDMALSNNFATSSALGAYSADSATTIGYSVGGAKDINNFRENIDKGYFPLKSDITYEGIFYDYSFDTGDTNVANSNKMFYPTYSTAVSKDPISENEEYYVSVGLNSNIKEEDFSRKKLNLVLVLDISGSMSSSLNKYYYDLDEEKDGNKEIKSKMTLAEESINILLDELNPDDSVGIVLFDNDGYLAKPLNKIGNTDIEAIKEHVLEVEAMGGTNFEAGYNLANSSFDEYGIGNLNEYENRIIVITDAMPNIGKTSKDGLRELMEENAKKGIYTSFIGVGLDFNSEVVKNIADVRGANYYSVSNEEEFKTRMGEEFEYMVTPLVFDLNMDLEADGFEIENIYGTDSIVAEDGNILHVNTLFPSKTNSDGEVKGGIILLKLKKTKNALSNLTLKVSYETRDGNKDSEETLVEFKNSDEYYDNTGIRKGIVLSRYVNLIKNWTEYERTKDDRFLITPIIGIFDYPELYKKSENERVSVKLSISENYKSVFEAFKNYMNVEIDEIGDETLNQEIDILDKILNV